MKNQRHIAIAADVWANSEMGDCPDVYSRMGDRPAPDAGLQMNMVCEPAPIASGNNEFIYTCGGLCMLFAAVTFIAIMFFQL